MKAFLVLCFVSAAFALQPCASPYGAAQVQAAPFASALPGAPIAFGPASPVNPALMARLQPMVAQFTSTLNSGNAEAHSALYTADAVVAPDNDYHYYGRTGAKKLATKNKAANILSGPIQIQDIKDGGAYLIMRGKFSDAKGPGDVLQYWQDVNGQLQLHYMLYDWDAPTTGGQTDPLGKLDVKKRVDARLDEWSKKYESGDIEGLSQMYMQFSKIFPAADDEFVRLGQEGARKVYQAARDSGITKITYEVVEADQAGDTVTAWAYYKEYKGTELLDEGTNVYVMKDVGGQLMIQYDIYNLEWIEAKRTATEKTAQGFYDDYVALFNAGKIPELMTMYVPDAVRTEGGSPTLFGIPAIQADLQALYDSGVRYHIDVYTATQAGDMIISTGRQRTLKNDLVTESAKLEDVLRMVGGKPKYFLDTQASN